MRLCEYRFTSANCQVFIREDQVGDVIEQRAPFAVGVVRHSCDDGSIWQGMC